MLKNTWVPYRLILLVALTLLSPHMAASQSGVAFSESFIYRPLIGSPYTVVTTEGLRVYDDMTETGPTILIYLKLPSNMSSDDFNTSGNLDEFSISASDTLIKLESALKSSSVIYNYIREGNVWFPSYAVTQMDFLSITDQYIYEQYRTGTLPEWFFGGSPDPATLDAYLSTASAEADAAWSSWYDSQNFSDAYGLITERQANRASSVLSYARNAILYPVPFSFTYFNELSGGIFEYYRVAIEDEMSGSQSGYTGMDINENTVGYWVRKNSELIETGAFESFFEIELFRYWFNLEFWFPDTWALFQWAESGRSALSLPQIVGNLGLSTEIASNALLPGKADPRRKSPEEGNTADKLRNSGGYLITPNAPKADLAMTFFRLYDNPGIMLRTGAGYDYTSPSGHAKMGADLLIREIQFEHLDSYLSTSVLGRFSLSPIRSFRHEGTGTLTLGATINEWMLHSNYLHCAASWTHQYSDGKLYAAGGALVSGSYWSQYPQMEVQTSIAGRLGISAFRFLGVNVDGIYTHSHGALWRGRWSPYEGSNLEHLNLGLGVDLYIGDFFGLSAGLRKDYLVQSYASWEFYLGGDFAF